MKKKGVIIILYILFWGQLFTQEFNQSQRVQEGDLTLLSEEISDLALAIMKNSELRLLRNMIYAKYGHIFNSKELTDFYSQFNWYKQVKKVSDNQLSEEELRLVKRIIIFENRQETNSTIVFGNELNGIWHITPIMPDTWLDRFVIGPNDKIEYLVNNFEENPEVSEYLGHYVIKGNTLIFFVENIKKNKDVIKPKENLQFKFPITSITEVSFMNGNLVRQMIKIGSFDYYLFYGDARS